MTVLQIEEEVLDRSEVPIETCLKRYISVDLLFDMILARIDELLVDAGLSSRRYCRPSYCSQAERSLVPLCLDQPLQIGECEHDSFLNLLTRCWSKGDIDISALSAAWTGYLLRKQI